MTKLKHKELAKLRNCSVTTAQNTSLVLIHPALVRHSDLVIIIEVDICDMEGILMST